MKVLGFKLSLCFECRIPPFGRFSGAWIIQCVPLATEPDISLIILPLMRILQRLQTHTTDTHYRHTLQTHTTDTHYRHPLQTHTTDTHYRHTLQTPTTDTHYRHTTHTFLFISHTTNVLLFKFRCNIFIGVRIIKEMPSSVTSGTPCICRHFAKLSLFTLHRPMKMEQTVYSETSVHKI